VSEPKRYLAKCPWYAIETQEHPMGEFVLYSDYARLKSEVERLTSAGDCLVIHIEACYRAEGYDPKDCDMIDNWDAAKGGKQP
jgi:hypothetical protein